MERLMVYVDGSNLYHGVHDASGRRALWLDLAALSRSLRPRSRVVGVKYFTAPVLGRSDALSRQTLYQEALQIHCGSTLSIVQGRYQGKTVICRQCGARRMHYEEKETDVNIAVHLVSDAAQRACDAALLISADSDLVPAVQMARRLDPGLFIAAAFPPRRHSAHLKALMPASFAIGIAKINGSQLPSVVVDARTGRQLTRPIHWT